MNFLVSYDWLKEYVDLKETPEEFAARVSLSGPGVERLYPQGDYLDEIVLGRVVEIKPHPQADKLRLAITDIGEKKLTIVCGGSNLKENQWVSVAKEGAKIKWHGEGEWVELKPTEIRGVKSEGMICAANEIGLFDAFPHVAREILDIGRELPKLQAKAGTPLATVLGLAHDTVMDVEITTNRPDAMSLVGLAREASAILKRPFNWKPANQSPLRRGTAGGLRVRVSDKKLCPRYMAAHIADVKVSPSPWWLKRRLLSAGVRPINNVVDITNFVMLELGEPMHAFDADKLEGDALNIREAKKGETIEALDGKTYKLEPGTLVIADAKKPVAVAGVMGGEKSGVTKGTTSIVFEAANFDPVSVRRAARSLNLYSDSQLRFEKGLSTEAPPFAMARAIELCLELCGGTLKNKFDVRAEEYKPKTFSVTFDEIKNLIGVEIPKSEVTDILRRLGFTLHVSRFKLQAEVPGWRDHDIESGRDLIEEIARVHGYANLPAVFPAGKATEAVLVELKLEKRLRQAMQSAGCVETFTYSFTSREALAMAGWNTEGLLRVQNPLSADFEFMRPSLLPSLLQVAMQNQERDREQKLFEIVHTYVKTKNSWKDLPDEELMLSALVMGDNAWRDVKGLAEYAFSHLGITSVEWRRLENDSFWHPGRSALAYANGHYLGTAGELHPNIAKRYGFDGRVALADLPLEKIFHLMKRGVSYEPLPTFPEVKRDLAVVVPREITMQELSEAAKRASSYLHKIEWFDTYRGQGLEAEEKSVAFHLQFASDNRTLESSEVEHELAEIIERLQKDFGAEVRT